MNLRNVIFVPILVATVGLGVVGCGGTVPLNSAYRAGDTVALAAGWKQTFDRSSLTATITGSNGVVTTLPPGSPAIRAIVNLYPDPVSYLAVGTRTGSSANNESTYGSVINSAFTNNDPDWWMTSVFIDLPASLPVGTAQVQLQSSAGETYGPIPVQIVSGTGSPSTFAAEIMNGPLAAVQLQSMEREPRYTVKFSGGSALPDALQVDLTHDPSSAQGGAGIPFVINPRGEMKNITWTDDGTHLRVLITTSGDGTSKVHCWPATG